MDTAVLSLGIKRGRGVMITTHRHIVPKIRMSRSYIFFPLWLLLGVPGQLLMSSTLPCRKKGSPLRLVTSATVSRAMVRTGTHNFKWINHTSAVSKTKFMSLSWSSSE
jgi:hypothetical protein